jgi:hypothetical protein
MSFHVKELRVLFVAVSHAHHGGHGVEMCQACMKGRMYATVCHKLSHDFNILRLGILERHLSRCVIHDALPWFIFGR